MYKLSSLCKKLLLITLCITLAGCGFHLRGDTPVPPEMTTLYLKTAKPYDALSKNLNEVLSSAGVTLVTFSKDAPVTLQIVKETESHSVGNIGTNTTTRQYNLYYTVIYQVTNSVGKVIAGPFTVSETSALMVSSNEMLSAGVTQNSLQDQMQQQAAQQILNVLIAPDTVTKVRNSFTQKSLNIRPTNIQ